MITLLSVLIGTESWVYKSRSQWQWENKQCIDSPFSRVRNLTKKLLIKIITAKKKVQNKTTLDLEKKNISASKA